jgi:hypothetical protein
MNFNLNILLNVLLLTVGLYKSKANRKCTAKETVRTFVKGDKEVTRQAACSYTLQYTISRC